MEAGAVTCGAVRCSAWLGVSGCWSKTILLVEIQEVMPEHRVCVVGNDDDEIKVGNAVVKHDVRVSLVGCEIDVLNLNVRTRCRKRMMGDAIGNVVAQGDGPERLVRSEPPHRCCEGRVELGIRKLTNHNAG